MDALVNEKDGDGRTPLHYAARWGDMEVGKRWREGWCWGETHKTHACMILTDAPPLFFCHTPIANTSPPPAHTHHRWCRP